MAQKETILGNYLNFPRFPLDCESMDYIQENIKHLAIIAQIAGCDRLIINGCTGSPRSAGYVYVRTGNDLLGEILYFPGGSGARCSIKTDNINASANGETFNAAYTMRKLVSGTTGTWSWAEDFTSLSAITNASLKTLIDGKAAATHTHNYAPTSHNHSISDITNLQSALDGKAADNHTHNYATPSHTHDDRYYTETEIDNKLAVTIDDHKPSVEYHKQGRVVYVRFNSFSVPAGYYENTSDSVKVPAEFRPAANYHGVGMVYFGNDGSNHPNSNNLVPFSIKTNGVISTMCYQNNATFEGSACYISAS